MNGQPETAVQREREAEFLANVGAFMRRDFAAIEATWRPDLVMTLPGSSWLAGNHVGYDEASRCVLGLRQVLASEERRMTFIHEGHQMIVRHDVVVHGPMHIVEMTLRVRIRYDEYGMAETIYLEPDDLTLFDHVLNTALRDESTG
jgi:hypothetical protein